MPTKHTSSLQPIPIRALIRRTKQSNELKALIRDCGATLTRKGRSSNWLLLADKIQLRHILAEIERAEHISWQWLAKLIRQQDHQYSHQELLTVVQQNPALTLKQLVTMTDCTLIEARKVMDEAMDI